MAHVITCNSCGRKSSVSDEIFDRRIAGKKVTLRCTQCREPIAVDGTKPHELRPLPPTTSVPVSSPEPTKASPPALDRTQAVPHHKPAAPVPPPVSARQAPRPKATLLGMAGLPMTPSAPQPARPRTPPPLVPPIPSARDEAVTLVDEKALAVTPIAASPSVPPIPAAPPPPLELAATVLQTTLSSVATPPPLPATPPVALHLPTAPPAEPEQTPSPVACPVEPPPPTSIGGIARDESSPSKHRRVGRLALVAALPLVAAAALAVGVFVKRGSLPKASALPPVPKTAAAKLDTPPPSAPVVKEAEASAAVNSPAAGAVSAPLPTPSTELAAPAAAVVEDESSTEPASEEPEIPSYVNAAVVLHRTSVALRRAERCHPHGHAVGTAQVYVTFTPNGRVVEARLEGEPLESAPVARCLLDQARSIRVPKFKGERFTIRKSVTLR